MIRKMINPPCQQGKVISSVLGGSADRLLVSGTCAEPFYDYSIISNAFYSLFTFIFDAYTNYVNHTIWRSSQIPAPERLF